MKVKQRYSKDDQLSWISIGLGGVILTFSGIFYLISQRNIENTLPLWVTIANGIIAFLISVAIFLDSRDNKLFEEEMEQEKKEREEKEKQRQN